MLHVLQTHTGSNFMLEGANMNSTAPRSTENNMQALFIVYFYSDFVSLIKGMWNSWKIQCLKLACAEDGA